MGGGSHFDGMRWPGVPVHVVMFLLMVAVILGNSASAHFKLNLNIRIFHIEHVENGLDVYLRLPMPYLVAVFAAPEQFVGSRTPAPFTTNAMVDGQLMHYVDYDAVFADPQSLGLLAADGHVIRSDGVSLVASVEEVRVYRGIEQPPFSTLEEAYIAFSDHKTRRIDPAPFVGDAVVDVLLSYRPGAAVRDYTLHSNLDPGLDGQSDTANLIVDTYGDDQRIYRVTGLMQEPLEIRRSALAAAWTFIKEGVTHILEGIDHVLFVVCLTLGAASLASLAWRVTGFTVGHSITLSLGFFGYTPSADWFIPVVETGIALSIIFAAIAALTDGSFSRSGLVRDGIITGLIGLLHGLGFSFVLQNILGITSPNIWTSLLAFNLGVELGQLLIVLLMWPSLLFISHSMPRAWPLVKWGIAVPCILIASLWTGQRISEIVGVILQH